MVASNIGNLRFAIQSVKGTAAASSVYGLYLAGGDLPSGRKTQDSFAETTSARMRSDRYLVEAHGEGSPQHYVTPKSIGALLYGALGGKSVTGAADPYTHTIIPAATTPWFTLWRNAFDMIQERLTDAKIKSLVIHGESGRPLTVTVNWLAITPQHKTAAETTAVIETTQRFMHYDGAGAFLVEGAAVASIRSFDLTIENNTAVVPGDSVTPNDVSEGELSITCRVTQLFLTATGQLRNRLFYGSSSPADNAAIAAAVLELAGSPAGLEFTFTRVAAAPGPERSLKLAIPRVTVEPFDPQPSTGNDPATAEISFTALQPGGNAMTATLKNGQATY